MRDSALKPEEALNNAREALEVGEELMRDSALKPTALVVLFILSLVGEELMRDSALKRVRATQRVAGVVVGEELMRDSALKHRLPGVSGQPLDQSEKSSCATAL